MINYRYGSYQIAKRHLEQILSAQMISLTKPIIESSHKHIVCKVMETSHDYYKNNILNTKLNDLYDVAEKYLIKKSFKSVIGSKDFESDFKNLEFVQKELN